ncbi:MAG: MmcQ/YjbR family DNA-binding protein [Oscillospiraceae bacterium]|nr:MmcQ/YjbR family DNA-binding protein [Oscillospiraceae bacterium]
MFESIVRYAHDRYKAEPEYPWIKFPTYAVFRHADNKKWFILVMDIPYEKIDPDRSGHVRIINLKLNDPLYRDMLLREKGFYMGYHIAKGCWISVVLDGTVPFEKIAPLIDMSYDVTASRQTRQRSRPPKEWLIPSNPRYYDIESAFENSDEIGWKQGRGIKSGDTVYMYVGSPVSAILYKCIVTAVNIPYKYDDGALHMDRLMNIKLLKRYPRDKFTFDALKTEYGIFAVRGPRGIPDKLSKDLAG